MRHVTEWEWAGKTKHKKVDKSRQRDGDEYCAIVSVHPIRSASRFYNINDRRSPSG